MGNIVKQSQPGVQYDVSSGLVTAVGAVLGLVGLAYVLSHPEPLSTWVVELVLVTVPSAAAVYGGYWTARYAAGEDSWAIAKWYLTGTLVAGALFSLYVSAEFLGGTTIVNSEFLILLGAIGGGVLTLFAAISTNRSRLADLEIIGEVGELPDTLPASDARAFARLAVDSRSWHVVHALALAEGPLGVETVADRIAAVEGAEPWTVHVDLVHARLPKLADEGVIHYDTDAAVVRPSDRIADVVEASKELCAAGDHLDSSKLRDETAR